MLLSLVLVGLVWGPITLQYLIFAWLSWKLSHTEFFRDHRSIFLTLLVTMSFWWGLEVVTRLFNAAYLDFSPTPSYLLGRFWLVWLGGIALGSLFKCSSFPSRVPSAWVFWGAQILFLFYAVIQFKTGWDIRRPDGLIRDIQIPGDGIYRIQLLTGHPNTVADIHGVMSLVFWGLFYQHLRNGWSPVFPFIGALAHLAFVVLSWTRFPLILLLSVMIVSFSVFFFTTHTLRYRWPLGLFGFSAFLILSVWFFQSTRIRELWHWIQNPHLFWSSDKRLVFWWVHARLFGESPLWGHSSWKTQFVPWLESQYQSYGWDWIASQSPHLMAHQNILQVLATHGVLGFGCWLIMVIGLGILSSRVSLGLLWGWVYLMLHGLIQNTFFDSSVMMVWLGILSWLIIVREHTAAQSPVPLFQIFSFPYVNQQKTFNKNHQDETNKEGFI